MRHHTFMSLHKWVVHIFNTKHRFYPSLLKKTTEALAKAQRRTIKIMKSTEQLLYKKVVQSGLEVIAERYPRA